MYLYYAALDLLYGNAYSNKYYPTFKIYIYYIACNIKISYI